MGSKSGAGAAVSSGASYQARVAAYLLVTAICGLESDLAAAGAVKTLGFETTEAVDDLNVGLSDGSAIYIQAKAKIEFSLSKGGELRSVLQQFEKQESRGAEGHDIFVLVTSSRSSKKVIYDLRAALDAFRKSPEREFFRDQPRALVDIIFELRRVMGELQVEAGRPQNTDIVDRVIRKSRVLALDVEAGDPVEQALILVIQSQSFAAPSAVWGKIVADCVGHSKARHTIRTADSQLNYIRYRIEANGIESQAADDLIRVEFGSAKFAVGKEVALCRIPESSAISPPGLAIMEFYRFDENCAERIAFSEDSIELKNGLSFPLMRRAATQSGLLRIIEADPSLIGEKQLTIIPLNSEEDFELGLCAELHRERLRKAALGNPHPLHCVHCGRPVSEKKPPLIEIGPLGEPIVGLTHGKCLAPSDRVLGMASCDFFEVHPELVNFDVNAWFRTSHGGQIAFANAEQLRSGRQRFMAWGGLNPRGPLGQHVVEISLQGGGREIVTERNGVHRFSRAEADEAVSKFNKSFEEARKRSDPICYTDESKMFGPRSLLIEHGGGKERIIPVERARVRRYDERFTARFSRPGQWYAPLLYLRCLASGEPLSIHNAVLLLTDPLRLANFLHNWREAKIEIPDYETANILSDIEFDEFMRWIEARGWAAVVDPLFDPTDGSLTSGLPIRSLEALLSERELVNKQPTGSE
jgi:hypothetical protein